MDAFVKLIANGGLSLVDSILICIIGILVYFVFLKQNKSQTDINKTVDGMKVLLEEERHQTEALSKTVYQIRKEMECEREKTYVLREEILVLKQENMRLQNLVSQMESMIKEYQEEIKRLKGEM